MRQATWAQLGLLGAVSITVHASEILHYRTDTPMIPAIIARESNDANDPFKKADQRSGQGIVSFFTAVGVAAVIFAVQVLLFAVLRNKLARIFKPKTYLVPERQRTEPPPSNFFAMIKTVVMFKDRDLINKCGLDAYFFLRYLKTLLMIFVPICGVVLPILIPLNYVNGISRDINAPGGNSTRKRSAAGPDTLRSNITGLDTLAWGNIRPENTSRYTAHLLMAILVVIWVCTVFFFELKAYIKVRQDYLTSAEHRLRASATTVLISAIPNKWLSVEALEGLFDVFPGGVRNIWLNRDLTVLLDKINLRDSVHSLLENAETEFIKAAKKAQLKLRDAEEKKERRAKRENAPTRKEKTARKVQEDKDARDLARSGEGEESGDPEGVPHTVADGVEESQMDGQQHGSHTLHDHNSPQNNNQPIVIETNGAQITSARSGQLFESARSPATEHFESERAPSQAGSALSAESTSAIRKAHRSEMAGGNTVRKIDNIDDLYSHDEPKFWQFWKPPAGGFAPPVPQSSGEEDGYCKVPDGKEKTTWENIKGFIPFMGGNNLNGDPLEYANPYKRDEDSQDNEDAVWKKFLKKKHRPTHHLSLFGVTWMPGVPWITQKVDTIYWCRKELARLNMEIEEDQKHPERFPLLNSAFVQFNHQIAAHMACQSTIHHIPRLMAPRMSEISPRDVVWDNMAMNWWQAWLRTGIVVLIVGAMIILWAIPVASMAALSQLDGLIQKAEWLGFLRNNKDVENLSKAIAGVLPALVVGLLLALVPIILGFLAGLKGVKTGSQKDEFIQKFYFVFLFLQLFLIVSIASFFIASLDEFIKNLQQLQDVRKVLNLLAENLPKAAIYFFSYMILQALSTSSGTLLQIGSLIMWYIIGPMFDSTARNKWQRNTNLNNVNWGAFFPVYTNFACIALIYCVIAPLISVFAIITFGLLWIAQRYAMIYVYRFENDTGGVLYPRAINQAFTGLYVMELCLAGLFYIVIDQDGNHSCTTHGTIMLVVFLLTACYQFLLHVSFSPLVRYLPVTLEDEAVLRDQAFQRAQDRRLGLVNQEDDEETDEATSMFPRSKKAVVAYKDGKDGVELSNLNTESDAQGLGAIKPVQQVGTWAKQGGKQVGEWAKDGGNQLLKLTFMDRNSQAAKYRREHRKKDLEAQRAMGDALYGEIHDEIEDLTPDERDMLVKHAFVHYALRARRPTVWIPRDDIGVSDDEIRQTKEYSDYVWISNDGTALDSKQRVVYGKNPPDFSEVDVINL